MSTAALGGGNAVREAAVRQFAKSARWRADEVLFWACALGSYFVFPDHLVLVTQVLISGLFALSLDLLLGYTGIPSLGHAAFFGIGGYTAGLLSVAGWTEPLSGLIAAAATAGVFGLLCSLVVARVGGIPLLTVTLGIGLLVFELANRWSGLTGGDDGLQGIVVAPVLSLFEFDLFGRTGFFYVLVVCFLLYLVVRRIVNSPFGLGLRGVRGNVRRMPALGVPVRRRVMAVFTLSAALAGVAGALLVQTTQSAALDVVAFDRSVSVLIMLVLGGLGALSGGMIGAAVYLVARDQLSTLDPVYWNFWLGLILFLVVLVGGNGVLGLFDRLRRRRA